MQGRAVAVYAVFFLLLGASSFTVIAVAEQPPIELQGQTYGQGDSLTADGREYTVTSLDAAGASGELTTVNESYRHTAELENGSTVTYEESNYTVAVPNGTNVTSFALQPANDTAGGPLNFSVGDQFQYDAENVTAEVASVESATVTLAWIGPQNQTVSLSEGANVTLGDQQYVVHFPPGGGVMLSTQVAAYQQEIAAQAYFVERVGGLWWVTMLSVFAAVLLAGLAYLPVRG